MDIHTLIERKRELLLAARSKVEQYENQIETLTLLSTDDEVDVALEKNIEKTRARELPEQKMAAHDEPAQKATATTPGSMTMIQKTPAGRNPRGSIRTALLAVFSDVKEHDLDEALIGLNQRIPSPVEKGALRNAVMRVKQEGLLISRKPGFYQLAKGETPADTGVSDATISDKDET